MTAKVKGHCWNWLIHCQSLNVWSSGQNTPCTCLWMRQGGLAALIPCPGTPCVGRGEDMVPFAPGTVLSGLPASLGC